MKKLLFTLCLFTCTASFSQNMSFEETAKYIKTKVDLQNGDGDVQCSYGLRVFYNSSKELESFAVTRIDIKTNGRVEIITNGLYPGIKFNIQKCLKIELDQADKVIIKFYITNDSFYYLELNNQIDAERVSKAFHHLKSILPKEKDPFDN